MIHLTPPPEVPTRPPGWRHAVARRGAAAGPAGRGIAAFLAATLLVSALLLPAAGCTRLRDATSFHPVARLDSSDGATVYFILLSRQRSYFGRNLFDHRIVRTKDFAMIEGVVNPVHHFYAKVIGSIEAICFLPAFVFVQIENFLRFAFIIPLGRWTAELTNILLYPFDWLLHDIPVSVLRFLYPGSIANEIFVTDKRPAIIASEPFPANENAFVFFLWPWFEPGEVARAPISERVQRTEEENLRPLPRR
jgi:hypothetical protein